MNTKTDKVSLSQALQFANHLDYTLDMIAILSSPLKVRKSLYHYRTKHNESNRCSPPRKPAVPKFRQLQRSITERDELSPSFRVHHRLHLDDENNLTIRSRVYSQKPSPEQSPKYSPLKQVYLPTNSIVARRKFNAYVPMKNKEVQMLYGLTMGRGLDGY